MGRGTAYKVQVHGRVTGVGFRYCAMDYASGLPGLKGYVRNMGHGHVEAFLQGDEASVRKMLDWLRSGPPGARIDQVDLVETPLDEGIEGFTIRETRRE